MPSAKDPIAAIKKAAAALPDAVEGESCNQSSFKAGKKPFLYVGPGAKGVGFGADIRRPEDKDLGAIFSDVKPEDLTKFGLIPEFIGRMPVVGAVNHLEREALVEILTEPRNALIKQYRKMFEFENVELDFEPDALDAIADEAIKRNTGARGLRAILEETLLQTMYDIPGRDDVAKVVVTRESVVDDVAPEIVSIGADRRAS